MNEAEDEQAWIRFGNARVQNLAYTDKTRKAYVADLIWHASANVTFASDRQAVRL